MDSASESSSFNLDFSNLQSFPYGFISGLQTRQTLMPSDATGSRLSINSKCFSTCSQILSGIQFMGFPLGRDEFGVQICWKMRYDLDTRLPALYLGLSASSGNFAAPNLSHSQSSARISPIFFTLCVDTIKSEDKLCSISPTVVFLAVYNI